MLCALWVLGCASLTHTQASESGREYHVAVTGDDANDGTADKPLRTIQAAAIKAMPGDTVTVHAGTYRERIDPPRGGTSDSVRITYRTAPGEKVVIKGSEVVKGWQKVQNDTWKVTLPNSFFGDYNPFIDLIRGDWFRGKGRIHHTGAVYVNDHWLTETVHEQAVLAPATDKPLWYTTNTAQVEAQQNLMNIAWLLPNPDAEQSQRVSADSFTARVGVQVAPSSEGGNCLRRIGPGDRVQYNFDFGQRTEQVAIRAASATIGGTVEMRLDGPDGELLGTCAVTPTGDWQKWQTFTATIKPTSGEHTLCVIFRAPTSNGPQGERDTTTIFAQFKGIDPNATDVEITARKAVFYPSKTGMNYITVRGFTMMHAATNWAPPTAEQVGLIGTHWSKGWVIEDNDIRYSMCSGVTLGKHGDEWDNRAESAEGYIGTINRGIARGWSGENIGHHVVRNNHIRHCEQGGIIGSLGGVFSTITGNVIHDIDTRGLLSGAEQAGIKIHASIDMVIERNHIYRCGKFGIWLDWMAQGTRVSKNLLHHNSGPDLFVEVNHGPMVVDNNVLLSNRGILDHSRGGAFAHNLIAGKFSVSHSESRHTPYHKPHSTEIVGLSPCPSGDHRYYNNIIVGHNGLSPYDPSNLPVWMAGNVFLAGAEPSKYESGPVVLPQVDPRLKLVEKPDGMYLELTLDPAVLRTDKPRPLVATEMLGRAKVPDAPFENRDGSPLRIDTDYPGANRNVENPTPGPFEQLPSGTPIKVWSRQ